MHKYLALFLVIGMSSAAVLITNGEFEEPLETGWFQGSSGSGVMTIVRETYFDPDPDYEVFVHKGDETGSIKLFQTVVIPTTDLEFSVNAKLIVYGTSAQCWSGAGVCILYLNASNVVLGSSKICAGTVACPWQSNDSCHVVAAIDTLWNSYAFNIDDELVNVPAVNGSDVAKIQISLLAQCVDD